MASAGIFETVSLYRKDFTFTGVHPLIATLQVPRTENHLPDLKQPAVSELCVISEEVTVAILPELPGMAWQAAPELCYYQICQHTLG